MSYVRASARRVDRTAILRAFAAAAVVGLLALAVSTGFSAGVIDVTIIAATLRFATPLTLAAIGGLFSERSGVVNIGLEGMMLVGAFAGLVASVATGSWAIALLVAMLAGAALALMHAVATVSFRADQIVTGLAVNLLALGLTGYGFRISFADIGAPAGVSRVPDITIQAIAGIPILGDVFGQLNLITWLMLAAIPIAHVVVFQTAVGLRLRSVGENPLAAETVGINVRATRYAAVLVSGALAALGGAYLSVAFVGTFGENMTAGRGYVALAALIFGRWRPVGAFGAALLFGFSTAIAQRLQFENGVSADLLSILPYLLTILALVGLVGRSVAPKALGQTL